MLTNSVLRACVAGRQAGAAELAVADLPSGMDCQLVGHIPLCTEKLLAVYGLLTRASYIPWVFKVRFRRRNGPRSPSRSHPAP